MKLEKTVTISQSIKLIKFYIIFANNEKIHNPAVAAVAGASAVQLAPFLLSYICSTLSRLP